MSISRFCGNSDYSWVSQLHADPETEKFAPNRSSREVKSGHYVFVKPTPLPQPELVALSPHLLSELDLDQNECETDPRFVRFFSGDVDALANEGFKYSWATPYALSIYGTDYVQNCPFRTGNGYGDGRAISVAEVVIPSTGKRWEFQLKGSGKTPFCRGGDGRAVLRSSVREFLASEAMFHLNVSTTRAISLIISHEEIVQRPWFSGKSAASVNVDELQAQVAKLPPQFQRMVLDNLEQQFREPDIMEDNPAAITCRVAPSFMRVGHIQLFERRARKKADEKSKEELELIVKHAIFREFPEIYEDSTLDFPQKVLRMLESASERIATLTADWIRVGYCQGNFNSDNCLISGRTMDYGPFGFMEKFKALWNMWTGGGEHFGFLNQHIAGQKNFACLARAVEPLLDNSGISRARAIANEHTDRATKSLLVVWSQKLGFSGEYLPSVNSLIEELIPWMEQAQVDYTIFWRQLSELVEIRLTDWNPESNIPESELITPLDDCFYKPLDQLPQKISSSFFGWLKKWLNILNDYSKTSGNSAQDIANSMKKVSPKYVPREWMLVDVYSQALKGNYSLFKELYNLLSAPYDEQPEMHERYYRKAPQEVYCGIGLGGTAFMT